MTLLELRKSKDIKSEDVARKMGISQGYYSNLERGKRPFNSKLVAKLAKALNVKEQVIYEAIKTTNIKSLKIQSWLSNIKINGLPFIKAFQYYVQSSKIENILDDDKSLKTRIKDFIESNIGFSVLAELSENKSLLNNVKEIINSDNHSAGL